MANQLTRYATVASVDTAGQGYFFGYSVYTMAGSTGPLVNTIDKLRVFSFVLPFRAVVGNIATEVTTGGGPGKKYGVGLYDTNKNLILETGALDANTTQVNSTSITSVTLEPGHYYLAQTSDSTSTATRIIADPGANKALINVDVAQIGVAANSAGAPGVLPATLGTITASTARSCCATVFST